MGRGGVISAGMARGSRERSLFVPEMGHDGEYRTVALGSAAAVCTATVFYLSSCHGAGDFDVAADECRDVVLHGADVAAHARDTATSPSRSKPGHACRRIRPAAECTRRTTPALSTREHQAARRPDGPAPRPHPVRRLARHTARTHPLAPLRLSQAHTRSPPPLLDRHAALHPQRTHRHVLHARAAHPRPLGRHLRSPRRRNVLGRVRIAVPSETHAQPRLVSFSVQVA